ncbi:MAG: hypothetical protein WJ306_10125 [Ferrovum myxofaciens]
MTSALSTQLDALGQRARQAARLGARASTAAKNQALRAAARILRRDQENLLTANAQDVAHARAHGQEAAFIERLTLTPKSIEAMASGLRTDCRPA